MRDEVRSSPVPQGRNWALNRLAYRAFTNHWFWLIFGLFVGGCGAFIALTAHLAHFHPITGTLASYSSDDNLRLAGQPTTYQFLDAGEFHPALPDQIPSGTRVTIWVLPGYTGIDALQVLDPQGRVQAQYTDDLFDHPAVNLQLDRFMGGLFAVVGSIFALISLLLPSLDRRQRSRAAGVP
jgi:hypothetical protein